MSAYNCESSIPNVCLDNELEQAITTLNLDEALEDLGYSGFIIQRCIKPTTESHLMSTAELRKSIQAVLTSACNFEQVPPPKKYGEGFMIEKIHLFRLGNKVNVVPLDSLPIKTVTAVVKAYHNTRVISGAMSHPLYLNAYYWLSDYVDMRIQRDIDDLVKEGVLVKNF